MSRRSSSGSGRLGRALSHRHCIGAERVGPQHLRGRPGFAIQSRSRAHNSAVECVLHTDEVTSSNLVAPTGKASRQKLAF